MNYTISIHEYLEKAAAKARKKIKKRGRPKGSKNKSSVKKIPFGVEVIVQDKKKPARTNRSKKIVKVLEIKQSRDIYW